MKENCENNYSNRAPHIILRNPNQRIVILYITVYTVVSHFTQVKVSRKRLVNGAIHLIYKLIILNLYLVYAIF